MNIIYKYLKRYVWQFTFRREREDGDKATADAMKTLPTAPNAIKI